MVNSALPIDVTVKKGCVYIAGSGPGNLSLLTLQCFDLIKKCDVIVYDRLVSDDILNIIPKSTEKIFAGKSCNKHYMTQEQINETLVRLANENKSVLRLKGGDPFIFGRGGEEAIYLSKHKVSFELAPGLSAAIGCSTYCGIPLTHRNISNGVTFITGHKKDGEIIDYDWKYLSSGENTLVIYMGLTNLKVIVKNLIDNGMKENMGVAIIEEGTTQNQKVIISSLTNIAQDVESNNISPPAIIIIGDVVFLRKTIEHP